MIKYALVCECSSKFEGWFPTNEGYENQLAQGQADIMAPNVKKKKTQIKIKSPRQRGKEAMLDMTGGQMVLGGRARTLIKKIETHVKENFENVGKGFAREARKAQVGDRNEEFYGTATKKEADELLNEGIDLFHVPEIKDN